MSRLRTHNTRQRKKARPVPSAIAARRRIRLSFQDQMLAMIASNAFTYGVLRRAPAKRFYLAPYHVRRARKRQRHLQQAQIVWTSAMVYKRLEIPTVDFGKVRAMTSRFEAMVDAEFKRMLTGHPKKEI